MKSQPHVSAFQAATARLRDGIHEASRAVAGLSHRDPASLDTMREAIVEVDDALDALEAIAREINPPVVEAEPPIEIEGDAPAAAPPSPPKPKKSRTR